MSSRVQVSAETDPAVDWLVVPVPQADGLSAFAADLDERLGGTLTRLRESEDLTGKLAETVVLHDVPAVAAKRVLLVGLGKPDEIDLPKLEKALRTAARSISGKAETSSAVAVAEIGALSASAVAEVAARAFVVGSVGQDIYRREPSRFPLESITLIGSDDLADAAARGEIIGEAINVTRHVVNRHPGDLYPETFAATARQLAAECDLECLVLDEKQLANERMGSMLAVAQGSENPARMVRLRYRGGGGGPTTALVGKGVTFDSGGLSLKPTDGMIAMKCDMAGAGAVLGAMSAIARLKLPVNVDGYMGLVENMQSGNCYKLGDVLTARNGTTIEVHNTDAEGRLVLADVLAYAVDDGADRIVDLATLTGACMVALGEDITGAFTNEEGWSNAVLAAAEKAGEYVWPMPMHEHFAELLKSDVADCKNVGPRWGGAVTAAKFLEKFVDGKPWVHLDIAGPSFGSGNKPHREGGGTGAMVATLVELVAS